MLCLQKARHLTVIIFVSKLSFRFKPVIGVYRIGYAIEHILQSEHQGYEHNIILLRSCYGTVNHNMKSTSSILIFYTYIRFTTSWLFVTSFIHIVEFDKAWFTAFCVHWLYFMFYFRFLLGAAWLPLGSCTLSSIKYILSIYIYIYT